VPQDKVHNSIKKSDSKFQNNELRKIFGYVSVEVKYSTKLQGKINNVNRKGSAV
jgi:hypothetical protein